MNKSVHYALLILFLILPLSLFSQESTNVQTQLNSLDDIGKINLLLQLSNNVLRINSLKSMEYSKQALEIAQKSENIAGEVSALICIGKNYLAAGKYIIAFEKFEEALSISETNNYLPGKIETLIALSDLHKDLSNYDKSNLYLKEALKLSIEIDNDASRADCLDRIGVNYRIMGEYDLAYQHFIDALIYFRKINDRLNEAKCLIHFEKLNLTLENYDEAFKLIEESLVISKEINNKAHIALAYNDLGWLYHKLGDKIKAIEYNKKAFEVRKQMGIFPFAASSLINIGRFYKEYGNFDKSQTYFFQALELIKGDRSFEALKSKLRVYDGLAELYSLTENYKNAFRYYQLHSELKKSLEKNRNEKKIEEMETNFEIEYRTLSKKTTKKMLTFKLEKQKILIRTMIVFFLLLLILIVVILWQYMLKRKQNMKLLNEIENRKKVEAELNKYKNDLKLINKILRHDLANDLAVINSALNLYKGDHDEKWLESIYKRIRKSINLIHSFREKENFAKKHSNLFQIDLKFIIQKLADLFEDVDITIKNNCEVMADNKLISVFENVINNAIKHGNANKIEFFIESSSVDCTVIIKNNGAAIPKDIETKIFDEGFSAGEEANTGLGLTIVKNYLEQSGGSISLTSNQASNVEFSITLSKALTN